MLAVVVAVVVTLIHLAGLAAVVLVRMVAALAYQLPKSLAQTGQLTQVAVVAAVLITPQAQ
jgi:hypothetical protein